MAGFVRKRKKIAFSTGAVIHLNEKNSGVRGILSKFNALIIVLGGLPKLFSSKLKLYFRRVA